jgi:hypothetical protein
MKTTILTVLGVALLMLSTVQLASAAKHNHGRKLVRAPIAEQFRNANNAIAPPAQPAPYSGYSDYSEGHMNMVGR